LLAHPDAAIRLAGSACTPAPSSVAIPAPRTTVTLTRDPVSGLRTLTVSF
jgi:hypothetical protein